MAKGEISFLPKGMSSSIKGSIGKAGVVGDLVDQTVPGQAFCVVKLRPNAPLNSKALVQYLRSEIGQCFFQKRSQGTGVAFIPMGDVKSIPVVVPSKEELKHSHQLFETSLALSKELKSLAQQLETLSSQGWLHDLPTAQKARAT